MLSHAVQPNLTQFKENNGFLECIVPPKLNKLGEEKFNEEKNVSRLVYETAPTEYPFDIYEAYKIRLTSFANGAIYAIKYSNLSALEKEVTYNKIKNLLETKLKDLENFKKEMSGSNNVKFSSELYQFYHTDLPNILPEKLKLNPKQIAIAEAMYVWQEIKRPTRITEYTRKLDDNNFLYIEQRDEPLSSKLTDSQKDELQSIHSDHKPKWFVALPAFAQVALSDIIPIPNAASHPNAWKKYEKCHPTILRHMPGSANGSNHGERITHKKLNDKGEVISETVLFDTVSIRQGTPTSFNMKDKKERKRSAKENLKQILSNEAIEIARANFKKEWEIEGKPDCEFEFPIFLGGLLTPWKQANAAGKFFDGTLFGLINPLSGGESNTLLTQEKDDAVDEWKDSGTRPQDIKIFNLNVGVNGQRGGVIQPDSEFIDFVEKFISKMDLHYPFIKDAKKQPKVKRNLDHLKYGLAALKKLNGKPSIEKKEDVKDLYRNENLYTASLYDTCTQLMYGYSTGNCKSAKDRKGVEIIMAGAKLEYLAEQEALGMLNPRIPEINDSPEDRKRFVDIFCRRYASGHQLLVAHDNSSGCPGIKDEDILDKDIVVALKEIYGLSKAVANTNKPDNTHWKKHRDKVKKYGIPTMAFILGATSVACMATGVLAPLGILGGVAATYLGTASLAVGLTINLVAIPAVGTAGVIGLVYGVGELKEKYQDSQNTFVNQIKRAKAKSAAKEKKGNTKDTQPSTTTSSLSTVTTTRALNNAQAEKNGNNDARRLSQSATDTLSDKPNTTVASQHKLKQVDQSIINRIENACAEFLDEQGNIKTKSFDYYSDLFPANLTRNDPESVRILLKAFVNSQLLDAESSSESKQTDLTFFKQFLDPYTKAYIEEQLPTWVNNVLIKKYHAQTDKFNPSTLKNSSP